VDELNGDLSPIVSNHLFPQWSSKEIGFSPEINLFVSVALTQNYDVNRGEWIPNTLPKKSKIYRIEGVENPMIASGF
jgi:hypothetical protein